MLTTTANQTQRRRAQRRAERTIGTLATVGCQLPTRARNRQAARSPWTQTRSGRPCGARGHSATHPSSWIHGTGHRCKVCLVPSVTTHVSRTSGNCRFAAHTKLDHATGELHAIAYFWAWDHVQHVIVDPGGKVTRTTDVPVPDGPMMHDFALTAHYVVLLDLPVTFSLNAVTQGKELPYVWNSGHQARVGLLPRDGSSPVRWIEIEPCWVFRSLNAHEDSDSRDPGRPAPSTTRDSTSPRCGLRTVR